ncbi:KAP family P-loop domain-containing protein [Agrobacterium fabrum]|uniref:KAP family P-loop NTPase fold protein n=1 Tax=Agrobacterium fabrum TaxID=1176649 RepID=UPI000886D4C7|nr:P-loop NTPase fold protein [Agrobacterium fabrum]MDH6295336.1 hypothetical protein [Agrobacterium fabrum]SDB60873.1 KAP family P-loop domain-containing protein [Agrobacterium fabrum]SER31037.1 KAP family P-loop domain-containing protein [Agrobacterium fabrum]
MADHWASDRLGRRQDAEFLYNFLIGEVEKRRAQGRIASYVLNVDADWGGGKSFFLDGLAQDLQQKGHLVARVNAWRDDHAQDPYVAIMAAIDNVYEPFIEKPGEIATAWKAAKNSGGAIALKVGGAIVKGLIKKHVGISTDDLAELVVEEGEASESLKGVLEDGTEAAGEQLEKLFDASLEAMIEGFKRTDTAMTDFRTKLENAVEVVAKDKPAPLFILVDELDRCRPTYAVQLLERVKHLFDVPGVVFVFATNADQLQHSISGSYGANFDGFRYLKRFFDRTYVFDTPSIEELISELSANLPSDKLIAPEDNIVQTLTTGCNAHEFDLRAIRQVLEMIDAAASAWPHKIPADIVLLFVLCANFYETGKAVWPSHQHPNITKWLLPRILTDRFGRGEINRSIDYGSVYRQSIGNFRSIGTIRNHSRSSGQDVASDYFARVYDPECNGTGKPDNEPSIQTELLGIVANAGRMVTASSAEG